jgi:hypothetical protein
LLSRRERLLFITINNMKQFTVIADMVLLRNGEEVFVDVDKWITDDKYLTAIIHEPLPTSTLAIAMTVEQQIP